MRAGAGVAALAAMAAASCAAPSRQLSSRIVEDPITLPKRMASASLGVTAVHYEPTDAQGVLFTPGLRFGLTDHLEWIDLLGLRYAFLDDRPADGRPPRPLSLALRAGAVGIGYSSVEGMIVLPVVSLTALEHVGNRWALSLSAGWIAQWLEYPASWTPAYNGSLVYSSRNRSSVSLRGSVVRQLSDHVALGVAPSIDQATDCVSPACGWKTRGGGVSLFVGVRPRSWLTLEVGPAAGVRTRANIAVPVMYPDGTAIPVQPRTVTWVALSGALTFYW